MNVGDYQMLTLPARQYPLDVTMSVPRRIAPRTRRRQTLPIEDYDDEFCYARRPPRRAAAPNPDYVIYVGTAAKVSRRDCGWAGSPRPAGVNAAFYAIN